MNVVTPQQVGEVLAALDGMGIHRESVRIPLETVPGGSVAIEGDQAVIQIPSDIELHGFVAALPERLRALPGAERLKPAEEGP